MDGMTILNILSRWTHVGVAILLVGGTLFMRCVLIPAAEELPDDVHESFRERLLARWRKLVGMGIGLLMISGFYNYIVVSIPLMKEQSDKGLYHMLVGIKILLAFVIFFLASALSGRSPKFEGLRAQRKKWLAILIVLSFAVVFIAGYLKVVVAPI